jgi:hypothetical protein
MESVHYLMEIHKITKLRKKALLSTCRKKKTIQETSGIALGYGLDDRGFESRQELGIFLLTTASRPALGPTKPPIQWVPGAISLGVKRQRHEADHSHSSNPEVKNARSYTSTPLIRLHGVVLSLGKKSHEENFTFFTRWIQM